MLSNFDEKISNELACKAGKFRVGVGVGVLPQSALFWELESEFCPTRQFLWLTPKPCIIISHIWMRNFKFLTQSFVIEIMLSNQKQLVILLTFIIRTAPTFP